MVGSGPFKFVEFKRDEHIILERNENYFREARPYLDRIVMRIVKDDSARAIALENGEIHFSAFESIPHILNRYKKADNLVATDQGYAAIGPITWLGGLEYFFLAYGLGTFGYTSWTVWERVRSRN